MAGLLLDSAPFQNSSSSKYNEDEVGDFSICDDLRPAVQFNEISAPTLKTHLKLSVFYCFKSWGPA